MAINNGIASMNPASPADLDPVSQGASQIRTIKSNLQSQFPNIGSVEPTNPTSTEFNQLVGIKTTETIQTQIDKLIAEDVIINGKYMPKTGGEFSGFVNYLTSLGNPTQPDQLAPKKYVDLMLPLAGGTLVGAGAQIKNPNLPIADQDLANKKFVVDSIAAATPIIRRELPLFDLVQKSTVWTASIIVPRPAERIVGYEYFLVNKVAIKGYQPGDVLAWPGNVNGSTANPSPMVYADSVGHIAFAIDDYPRIYDKSVWPSTASPSGYAAVTAGNWQVLLVVHSVKS